MAVLESFPPLVYLSSSAETAAKLYAIEQGFRDASATRYLGLIGLVILVFDHVLTFRDEVVLVWAAPHSFSKYGFLFNRYFVLACLVTIAHSMCGFAGNVYSDKGCRSFLSVMSPVSLISVGVGNFLVLLRVVTLWDHKPIVTKVMTGGFVVSFVAQVALMILALIDTSPGIHWNDLVRMCSVTVRSPHLVGVWAAPMLFEFLVLLSTVWNALDRPQQARLPLVKALHRDGIAYFVAVTVLRVFNLAMAAAARPSLAMVGVFFVWGMTTTILNRSLLRLQRVEMRERVPVAVRSMSPFGLIADLSILESPHTESGYQSGPETPPGWMELPVVVCDKP